MADKISITVPGSLQAGCSNRSYRLSVPFGGSRGGKRRIGGHPVASVLKRLDVLGWTCPHQDT
jgi:hypothetical protein